MSSNTENLIPVFVPPLALLLAQSEKLKRSPLTEEEVSRIRDNAECLLMAKEHAAMMTETRGYRDVSTRDPWSDWHRLRAELTGNGFLPKIVLCVVGDENLAATCTPILDEAAVEYEIEPASPQMLEEFQASASQNNTPITAQEFQQIAAHKTVISVLSSNYGSARAPAESFKMLALTQMLLSAGAVAAKCESSGISHSRVQWNALYTRFKNAQEKRNAAEFWSAAFNAFVQWPIKNGDEYLTCGMHLLGSPDLIVSERVLQKYKTRTSDTVQTMARFFEGFANYLLVECANGEFCSGDTFKADEKSPALRVEWEACAGYRDDELAFNPFGRWRFYA